MLGHRPLVIEDYFAILKRRGWMILIPALLMPIIAVAITYKMTPIYTSQTLVLIEPQTVPDTYVKPIIAEDLDSRLASMKEQILSRSRLEPIIERFNLGSPGMDMDDKIAPDAEEHRHHADSFRDPGRGRTAGILHLVHGVRSAHGSAGVPRDYLAVCE